MSTYIIGMLLGRHLGRCLEVSRDVFLYVLRSVSLSIGESNKNTLTEYRPQQKLLCSLGSQLVCKHRQHHDEESCTRTGRRSSLHRSDADGSPSASSRKRDQPSESQEAETREVWR